MLLVELPYTLATEEAERIGVDHVARMSTSDTGTSSTGEHRLWSQVQGHNSGTWPNSDMSSRWQSVLFRHRIRSFQVAEHLTAQHSAIKMLHGRVRVVLEYIKAVEAGEKCWLQDNRALLPQTMATIVASFGWAFLSGELPKNHEILREAYSLCHRLPVLNTERFKEEFYNVSLPVLLCSSLYATKTVPLILCITGLPQQCNDVSLMTYLGTMTKGCNTINQVRFDSFTFPSVRSSHSAEIHKGVSFCCSPFSSWTSSTFCTTVKEWDDGCEDYSFD